MSLLLLSFALLFLQVSAIPSPPAFTKTLSGRADISGPVYTWENPPPADANVGGSNNGNQIDNFFFYKWVSDVQNGKGTTPEQAMSAYKASQYAKRQAQGLDDDDDDDDLPPWHPNSPSYNITKRAASTGPRCYWHKNQQPLVKDTFTVVSTMAYHPELYTIEKNGGKNITRQCNTASLNVRSTTGQKYGVAGTDVARAAGSITDYCTWKGRSGGGECSWGNGYLYVTIEHTQRGETTMQENLMSP